eukprot:CAMPEP_0171517846 /NCGR_PEP_ID=MMETSP0959-20130129/4925_1 /TAXON_ID=87120 /ORGANISM="Aurantiochytrium limacinum, Strain ATCCMYA-1381" /LENGTH=44 /DNA_ID= /DNA_START= /DNA_END= /DNA_ORIENTATION=
MSPGAVGEVVASGGKEPPGSASPLLSTTAHKSCKRASEQASKRA